MNNSFVSAVEHKDNPDKLMVRARVRKHLEVIFPARRREIFTVKNSDYEFRIEATKEEFAKIVSDRVLGINYGNFKDSVKNKKLKMMYSEFWYICASTFSDWFKKQYEHYYTDEELAYYDPKPD